MEPIRLHGKERHDWERAFFARHTRSRQLVLRILAGFAGGKAECWPTNRKIAETVGIKPRAVQLILRSLEAAGAIRCIEDEPLAVQRRIVLLGHPGTPAALRSKRGAKECAPDGASAMPERNSTSEKSACGAQSSASEVLNKENSKEKPVVGPADPGPADEQAEDWMRQMSPALRARFQGLIDGLSHES